MSLCCARKSDEMEGSVPVRMLREIESSVKTYLLLQFGLQFRDDDIRSVLVYYRYNYERAINHLVQLASNHNANAPLPSARRSSNQSQSNDVYVSSSTRREVSSSAAAGTTGAAGEASSTDHSISSVSMDMSGSADSNKSQSSSSSTAMDVEEPTIVQTQTQTTNARLAIACNCSWPDCPGTLDSPDKCSECREVVHRLCQSNCESRNGWRQLCEEKLYCPTHHPAQIKETNDSISNTSNTSTTVVTRTTRLDPEIGNVLAKPPPSNPSKRSRSSLSDDVKIDNVYQSLDALGSIQSLLQSTLEAQQSVSSDSNEGGLNELTCKSLQLAIDSLKEETAIIASSCANTSAKKQADVAHSKTTKDDRRVAKSKAAMQKKLNACKTPIEKLSWAIKSWSLKKADQDERRAAKSRKSTVVTDASTRTGTSSSSAATAATAAMNREDRLSS